MATTASHQQTYISNARTTARAFWDALNALLAMQAEWNAQDYGNTLADGAGANAGISKGMVGAAVFDTANAVKVVMNAGSATNLTNLL